MPDTAEKPRPFHLWIDVETTGLDIHFDSILEMGWVITDENLAMVSPLRQRITNLTPPSGSGPASFRLNPDDSKHSKKCYDFRTSCWEPGHLPVAVEKMHAESGLRAAWEATGVLSRLNHPRDIVRLIADDLMSTDFRVGTDKLVLSGAGVSHFENRLLPIHFSELFDGSAAKLWAYWQCDPSNAWRLIGDPMKDKLRRRGLDHGDSPWGVIQVENDVDDSLVHLVGESSVGTVFMPGALVKHRAADDVVAALIDARILRRTFELA